MKITGTFEISLQPEPPFDDEAGVKLARARGEKTFTGPLSATSVVHMTSCVGPIPKSAGYVAIERVRGSLDGKQGTFVLQHLGVMSERGGRRLEVSVVPDSGTGALAGLRGTMEIRIEAGQHYYDFDYEL